MSARKWEIAIELEGTQIARDDALEALREARKKIHAMKKAYREIKSALEDRLHPISMTHDAIEAAREVFK